MRSKRIVAPALLFVLFATLLVELPLAIADRASVYEWFSEIQDIRFILSRDYVREPDQEAMHDAMIDAMIEVLDDPYTQYVPPRDTAEFNKQLRGTYAGIGAEVNVIDGYLTIATPMDDSPALHAGVLAGDVVLEIEGESTFEVPIEECVERLTGEPGTPVTIKVRHVDDTEEVLEITRAHIVTRTVKGIRRAGGEAWGYCVDPDLDVIYVRVTQFNQTTLPELREVLDEQIADGLGGLVLDLRDNPGGGLPAAVGMADMFIDSGVIVSVKPRANRGDEVVYRARAEGTLPDFPMVVLVNGQSASASEIVSGALQDAGRAKIVGTRTFGKGSVQEVRELKYGAGTLKFTTAHYYLPSGRNINRTPDGEVWGVDPDPGLVVTVTDDDYIEYFRARRNFEIIRAEDETDDQSACVDAAWIDATLLDEQLATAVRAVRQRITDGAWPRLSDDEAATVAFGQELQRAARARTRAIERLRSIEERITELQGNAKSTGRTPAVPAGTVLTNGTIAVRDAAGTLIGRYRIEGGDVGLALDSMTLKRIEDDGVVIVLGIESSCDETAAGVADGPSRVLSNVIATQHELHERYAGVVPEIASRAHLERIMPVVAQALSDAAVPAEKLDGIAVGHRPGLIGSLLVGVSAAKALAWGLEVPLVGVDHLHAHLAAGLIMDTDADAHTDAHTNAAPPLATYPAIGLVVSGGHTALYLVRDPLDVTLLGRTIDDAVGEAYDKSAAILGLGYPGGPRLDRLAQEGDDRAHDFPVAALGRNRLDFSFSGLKTSVLYAVCGTPRGRGANVRYERDPSDLTDRQRADFAASFQRAAIRAITRNVERALEQHPDVATLLVGGGVAANSRLRRDLQALATRRGLDLRLPRLDLCLDNAAMIACLGALRLERGDRDDLHLSASPRSEIGAA